MSVSREVGSPVYRELPLLRLTSIGRKGEVEKSIQDMIAMERTVRV